MKYILTTDTHFDHEMLKTKRGKDFSEKIMKNFHNISGDVLIHLGDIAFKNEREWNNRFVKEMKKKFKKVILVRGNHDSKSYNWYYNRGWDNVCETMRIRHNKKEILFSHMPILAENSIGTPYHKVHMNIHGHLHGSGHYSHRAIEGYDAGYHYDIAPENHNLKPVDLDTII